MKRFSFSFLRSPKFWQRAIFSVALFASLVAAVYLVENHRGEAAWERYRAEAVARGVKLDFREFIPPPIPDEENFTKAPLFQELGSPDPAVRGRWEKATYLLRGSGAPQVYPKGRNGEVVELAGWQKYFVERGYITKTSDNAAADVLAAMERYAPALEQLREAASRQGSRLDAEWEKGFSAHQFGRGWPATRMLWLSETLDLHIAALLTVGRHEDAMADWRLMNRLPALLKKEPTLLLGMLRVMLIASAVNTGWQGLSARQWSAEELQEFETQLAPIELLKDYRFAMSCERAAQNSFLFEPLKATSWIERPAFLARLNLRPREGLKPWAWRAWEWQGLLPIGWFCQNQLRINQWHDRHLAETNVKSDPSVTLTSVLEGNADRRHSWLSWPYSFLERMAIFQIGSALASVRETQSDVQLFRVACALERFRLRTGSYPPTLESLVPGELALPSDAFAQPVRYRVSDEEIILYSVGNNGRDDAAGDDDLIWRAPRHPNVQR